MARTGRPRTYDRLLEDPDIKRWFRQMCAGSEVTARTYVRRLAWLERKYKVGPKALIKMEPQKIRDLLADMIWDMHEKERAGGYIESIIKAVRSWLNYNNIVVSRLKIPGVSETPTLEGEVVPTKDDLQKVLDSEDIRAKFAVSFLAFTGSRPEVLGRGSEGLKLKDIPDLIIDNEAKAVSFKAIPAVVRVRKPISKLGHEYMTLLNKQGCEYLKQYLEARMRKYPVLNSHGKTVAMAPGEKLTGESAVLTQKWDRKNAGKHVSTIKVLELVRGAIRSAGFRWRPYILRRYFDHNLLLDAVAMGEVPRDFVVFWMGHVGDIEHTYTLHKALPATTVEKMRDAFQRASEKYLETTFIPSEDFTKTLYRNLLVRAGVKDEKQIDKVLVGDERLIDARVSGALMAKGLNVAFGKRKQKSVKPEEVDKYQEEGWRWVGTRKDGMEVIELVSVAAEEEIAEKTNGGS